MTRDLHQFISDGFLWRAHAEDDLGYALPAFRAGFRAYLAAHVAQPKAHRTFSPAARQLAFDFIHTADYLETYAASVLGLHQFFELAIKAALRRVHPLLVDRLDTDPLRRYAALTGQGDAPTRASQSEEFGVVLKTACALVKEEVPELRELGFLANKQDILQQLAGLRNRLVHRGQYVLRYRAYDAFFFRHIIPLAAEFLSTPSLAQQAQSWLPPSLAADGTRPFHLMIECATLSPYDMATAALLKELCRAAYNSAAMVGDDPLVIADLDGEILGDVLRAHSGGPSFRLACVVCGADTLVISRTRAEPAEARCYSCDLRLTPDMGSIWDLGIRSPDFWSHAERVLQEEF